MILNHLNKWSSRDITELFMSIGNKWKLTEIKVDLI